MKLLKQELDALARKLYNDLYSEEKENKDYNTWLKSKEAKDLKKKAVIYKELNDLFNDYELSDVNTIMRDYYENVIKNKQFKQYTQDDIADILIIAQIESEDLEELLLNVKKQINYKNGKTNN